MTRFDQLLLSALLLAPSAVSQAALIGEAMNGQLDAILIGTVLDENETVVDPGVEFTFDAGDLGSLHADFSDTSLSLSLTALDDTSLGSGIVWSFTLLDPALSFSSVVETNDTWLVDVSFTGFSADNRTIYFSAADHVFDQGTYIATYDIGVQVPAPATLLLLLGGIVAMGRRRPGA